MSRAECLTRCENWDRKLLAVGRGNWNYFLVTHGNRQWVASIAKQGRKYKGCKSAYFGNMDYFKTMVSLYPHNFREVKR
jgi:hypothetical protein